jgi:hypothetical protein
LLKNAVALSASAVGAPVRFNACAALFIASVKDSERPILNGCFTAASYNKKEPNYD